MEYLTFLNVMGFLSVSVMVAIGFFLGFLELDRSPQKSLVSFGAFILSVALASLLSGYSAVILNTLIYHTDITPILDLLLRRTIGLLFMIFSDSDNNAITFLFYVSFFLITILSYFIIRPFLKRLIKKPRYTTYYPSGNGPYFVGIIMGFVAVSMFTSGLSKISVVDKKSKDSIIYQGFRSSGNFLTSALGVDLDTVKSDYAKTTADDK